MLGIFLYIKYTDTNPRGHWRSPNTGRDREDSRHWIMQPGTFCAYIHGLAWSHSLHQLDATKSVHAMYLRDWCFLADSRVFIQSCFRMSSFAFLMIASAVAGSSRHFLIKDWISADFILEPLHCSTRLIYSTYGGPQVPSKSNSSSFPNLGSVHARAHNPRIRCAYGHAHHTCLVVNNLEWRKEC